jgi:hypothetical protein
VPRGLLGPGPLRGIAQHDSELGLEIEAVLGVYQPKGLAWTEHVRRAALVDQRIHFQGGGRRGVARPSHEPHVVEVGGAIDPLGGAR